MRVVLGIVVAAVVLSISACGGPTGGTGGGAGGGTAGGGAGGGSGSSVIGTVAGVGLNLADSMLNASDSRHIYIDLSDKPMLCAGFKANRISKSMTFLSIGLRRFGPAQAALVPVAGEYQVVAGTNEGLFADAFFSQQDATCNAISSASAKSGLVTVTQINPDPTGSATGTFDLTFGSDRVTGTFSSPVCVFNSTGSASCE